jgi:hypothetical protein
MIRSGEKVQILSQNLDLKFYLISHHGKQGRFLMQDFTKIIERKTATKEVSESH